jgi:hypothetical protein
MILLLSAHGKSIIDRKFTMALTVSQPLIRSVLIWCFILASFSTSIWLLVIGSGEYDHCESIVKSNFCQPCNVSSEISNYMENDPNCEYNGDCREIYIYQLSNGCQIKTIKSLMVNQFYGIYCHDGDDCFDPSDSSYGCPFNSHLLAGMLLLVSTILIFWILLCAQRRRITISETNDQQTLVV